MGSTRVLAPLCFPAAVRGASHPQLPMPHSIPPTPQEQQSQLPMACSLTTPAKRHPLPPVNSFLHMFSITRNHHSWHLRAIRLQKASLGPMSHQKPRCFGGLRLSCHRPLMPCHQHPRLSISRLSWSRSHCLLRWCPS